MDYAYILNELLKFQDKKYADFSLRLTPNAKVTLGVSIPKLREIAKLIDYDNLVDFIYNFSEEYQECLLLKGICICRLKGDVKEILQIFNDFIPKICDWCVCDTTCCGLKIFKKNREVVFEFLKNLSNSEKEFDQRVVAVCLLAHFLTDDYIEKSLKLLEKLDCGLYYTDMAVGWCVATAFAKNREVASKFLNTCKINDRAYNYAIKKMRESLRVSLEDKEFFKNKIRN